MGALAGAMRFGRDSGRYTLYGRVSVRYALYGRDSVRFSSVC